MILDTSEAQQNICVEDFISWKIVHQDWFFFKTSVKRIIIRLMKVKIPKIMCDTKNLFFTDLQITMIKESVFPWEQRLKFSTLSHPFKLNQNYNNLSQSCKYNRVGFFFIMTTVFLWHVIETKTSTTHHRKKNKRWCLIAKLGTKYHTTCYTDLRLYIPP